MVSLFVITLLCMDNQVLLARRVNAQFGNGLYSLIGGKVEAGETASKAIRRETLEEVGLDIAETNFKLVHTFHRKGVESELVVLCFRADISNLSKPINCEPDKQDDLRFFDLHNLPENMIPAHKQALNCINKNIFYSEHGW